MGFLRKLFKRPTRTEVKSPPSAKEEKITDRSMQVGWITDVGKKRSHNEDALLVLRAVQEGENGLEPFGLFVLADGMGGHQSGEVVSALAVRTVANYILQHVYLSILQGEEHGADQLSLKEILVEGVNLANRIVAAEVPGGGTTLICALFLGSRVHIANVGDSRAYMVTPDGLEQITRDHSLVDRLVELGQLTAEEAAHHPQKNVLYRAVGQGGVLEVDTFVHSVQPGHGLLLCSDGLWGMLEDEAMLHVISRSSSPQAACDELALAANDAGGRDNISAILVMAPD